MLIQPPSTAEEELLYQHLKPPVIFRYISNVFQQSVIIIVMFILKPRIRPMFQKDAKTRFQQSVIIIVMYIFETLDQADVTERRQNQISTMCHYYCDLYILKPQIRQMLQKDAKARPSAAEIMNKIIPPMLRPLQIEKGVFQHVGAQPKLNDTNLRQALICSKCYGPLCNLK